MKGCNERALALSNRNTAREFSSGEIMIYHPAMEFETGIEPSDEIYLCREDIRKLYKWIEEARE